MLEMNGNSFWLFVPLAFFCGKSVQPAYPQQELAGVKRFIGGCCTGIGDMVVAVFQVQHGCLCNRYLNPAATLVTEVKLCSHSGQAQSHIDRPATGKDVRFYMA